VRSHHSTLAHQLPTQVSLRRTRTIRRGTSNTYFSELEPIVACNPDPGNVTRSSLRDLLSAVRREQDTSVTNGCENKEQN
jgi:hypothetical protein